MSKLLDRLQRQIKLDGPLPEHLEVLKLFNYLANTKSLNSTFLWQMITNVSYDSKNNRRYSIKPEFKKLLNEWK